MAHSVRLGAVDRGANKLSVLGYKLLDLTPAVVRDYEDELLKIAADVPGEYWKLGHFLLDLPEKWNLSFVVWDNNLPVAYAVLSKKEPTRAHLHHFMVASSYRNKGIGSAMVAEMERRVGETGCLHLTLKVGADNEAGQRFYARHGYSEQDRDDGQLVLSKGL